MAPEPTRGIINASYEEVRYMDKIKNFIKENKYPIHTNMMIAGAYLFVIGLIETLNDNTNAIINYISDLY